MPSLPHTLLARLNDSLPMISGSMRLEFTSVGSRVTLLEPIAFFELCFVSSLISSDVEVMVIGALSVSEMYSRV